MDRGIKTRHKETPISDQKIDKRTVKASCRKTHFGVHWTSTRLSDRIKGVARRGVNFLFTGCNFTIHYMKWKYTREKKYQKVFVFTLTFQFARPAIYKRRKGLLYRK